MQVFKGRTRRLLHLSLLISGGTALHVVEYYLPSLSVLPGAKLGLANIVTMFALTVYPAADVWKIVVLRVLLGSLLAGTFFTTAFFLSAGGAIGSAFCMMQALKLGPIRLGVIGISVIGAVTHNLSQLITVALIIRTWGIFFYLPYLLLYAIPTGYFIGVTTNTILRAFSSHHYFDRLEMISIDRI